MLSEIKTFDGLFNFTIINEGYFHVPQKVYDEILKDYYEVWKKVHTEGRKLMREETFPVKKYELDFSGTSFDFLNELDPKPSVIVKFSLSDKSFFDLLSPPANYPKNIGFMQIDLKSPKRVVIDLIEHELSHYVQDYIQKYRRIKRGGQNVNVYSPKMPIGGLPPKSMIDSEYTTQGYKIGSKQKRRTRYHSLRPVEYYPDLLSAIRHLEYAFAKDNPDYFYNPKEPTKYETEKKQFFLNFLNKIKNGEKTGIPLSANIFKDFKKISPEFYKRIVKIAYDAFVNKDPNLNVRDLIKMEQDIENLPKKINSYFFTPTSSYYYLKIETYDVSDVSNDVGSIFDIDDGYYIAGEEILNSLDVFEKYNKREERHEYNLPKSTNAIIKLFKKLKKYKDSNRYIFGDDWKDKINENDYPKAYNALFEFFKKRYMKVFSDKDKENFNQFLESLNF
jgi:hypothetical protein